MTLFFVLTGTGWQVDLHVRPSTDQTRKEASFEVMRPDGTTTRTIQAEVFYARGDDFEPGRDWPRWFVKIYRCATKGDAEELRLYLLRQASDIQRANAVLGGTGDSPFTPPWAAVPVHIIRGELRPPNPVEPPAWFAPSREATERTLLSVSPLIEKLTWTRRQDLPQPGIQLLADFRGLAEGLDTLHDLGVVHSDITPINVCRYTFERRFGFVLVDVDAAERLTALPRRPRATDAAYMHRAVREWGRYVTPEWRQALPDPVALLANDRFGFALVILTALAGEQWVGNTLLRQDPDPTRPRTVDDPDEVARALRNLWRANGRRWEPLIRVLVEPFGPSIETTDWKALTWLDRLIDASDPDGRRPPARPQDIARHRSTIGQIRADARRGANNDLDQTAAGYRAAEDFAQRVAWRATLRVAAMSALGFTVLDLVVLISYVVLGK